MISNIKKFYHFLVRSFPIIFSFIYAVSFIFYLKKISNKKNYKKKILVLNKARFWNDLKELDKSHELLFLYFEKEKLSLITEPFVKVIRKKMTSTFWGDYKDKSFFTEYLNEHSKFIFYFLKFLNFFIKFDSIITPSLWYLQDRAFEKGAHMLNKKMIYLHKENTIDPLLFEANLKLMEKKPMSFETNSSIIVYNDNTKKIIDESGKINPKKVFKLGCPRIDRLFSSRNDDPSKITLCSFRYDLGNILINRGAKHLLETDDPNLKLYFNNVHKIFIELAANFKDKEFVIKIKYEKIWKKLIEDLIIQKEKSLDCKIDNLKIISTERTMEEVLRESKLVIGINSLSLIEARILGIPCITPNFKEISGIENVLLFKRYLSNEIIVVNNEDELSAEVKKYLQADFKKRYTEYNQDFIKEYFGYSDGGNTQRYVNFLLEN